MDQTEQIEQVEAFVEKPTHAHSSSTHEASSSGEETGRSGPESSDEEDNEADTAEEYQGIFAANYTANDRVEQFVDTVTVEEFEEMEEFDEVHPMEQVGELEQLKEIQLGEDFQGAHVEDLVQVDQYEETYNSIENREHAETETFDPVEDQEDVEAVEFAEGVPEAMDMEASDPTEGMEMEVDEQVDDEYDEVGTPLQLDDSNSETGYFSDRESILSQKDPGVQVGYEAPDFDYIEPARYSEPAGSSFHNLETFTLNATAEDLKKRMESLERMNTFLTREAYEAYSPYKLHPDHRALLEVILETEERLKARKHQAKEPIVEAMVPIPTQVLPVGLIPTDKYVPPEIVSPSAKKRKVAATATAPAAPTVLDAVLTGMLNYNRSQTVKQEPSDLEIAAMAAGLLSQEAPPTENQSQFTKEQHARFLKISEDIRNGSKNVADDDMKLYKQIYVKIKQEQEEFMNIQKKQMWDSGVYDTLDEKVEKMIENYCEVEYNRILQYHQHYKYYNILNMPPIPHISTNDSCILSFKSSLLQTGKIAPCKPSAFETPRRLDLFKKYIFVPPKENDEVKAEEEEDTYYKKKYPPTVSQDINITHLMQTNKSDIVIGAESLIALVGLIHELSTDLCVPIKVVVKDNVRTLIMDRPLPREEMTARERNQIVYDLTFKSLCLDWKKRHDITPIVGAEAEEIYVEDENLQYNLWTFGDMNILIRHQADGEILDNTPKKTTNREKRVYLTCKLDYQISEGREEITTPKERSANWLRSYIGGHATVMEGRIDVVNNRLLRVEKKQMVDIMGGQWRPMLESELLRNTFSRLYKMLTVPGDYLMQHKRDDRNFLIYQSSTTPGDVDLFNRAKIPILSNSEKSFIPGWSAVDGQIPWTFPPR